MHTPGRHPTAGLHNLTLSLDNFLYKPSLMCYTFHKVTIALFVPSVFFSDQKSTDATTGLFLTPISFVQYFNLNLLVRYF